MEDLRTSFRFTASLVWYNRKKQMPNLGNRIIVFSPGYKEHDPMRVRIIDAQFYKLSKDAEWWAYINLPNTIEKR